MKIGYRETDSGVFTQVLIFQGVCYYCLLFFHPSVRPSVHLYECISEGLTGRIFMKCYIGEFYENVTRKSKFG